MIQRIFGFFGWEKISIDRDLTDYEARVLQFLRVRLSGGNQISILHADELSDIEVNEVGRCLIRRGFVEGQDMGSHYEISEAGLRKLEEYEKRVDR